VLTKNSHTKDKSPQLRLLRMSTVARTVAQVATSTKMFKAPVKKSVKHEEEDVGQVDIEKEKAVSKVVVKKEETPSIVVDKLCELSESDIATTIKVFIDLIYKNTHCVGGMHKKTLYKELPNTWSGRKNFTEDEKKYECTGEAYNDCSVEGKINKYVRGDIKLIWKFNKIKLDQTVSLTIDKDAHNALNKPKVLGYMKTLSNRKSDIFFNGTIVIDSGAYDSEDHRGSDHCLISLPTENRVRLESPTFEKFVEALYLTKCKKFDKWYELYTGCVVTVDGSMVTIKTKFDNGS
ncbi:hypothetical protein YASMINEVIRUS_1111, partial [Yasminevirus sp. GU-2018]